MLNKIELEIDEKRLNNLRRYASEIDAENFELMGCSCCKVDLSDLFFNGIKGYIEQSLEEVFPTIYSHCDMFIYDYEISYKKLTITMHEEFDQEEFDAFMEMLDAEDKEGCNH